MQTFNLEYFLDRKLDLPLNSFKTKANAFYNARESADVVVVKLFTKFTLQENRMHERQTFDWMNSIKFKASLCRTLDVSNSKRMHQCICYDFADRKIKAALIINQAYLACRRCCQILRRFFSQQEKGMNVKLSMGIIKSNPKLPLRANIRRVCL